MKKRMIVALLGLGTAGCFNRSHMSDNYGRAFHEAFARQAVTPLSAVSTTKFPKGLDALESSIVVETYRSQLAPKGGNSNADQSMILLSPNSSQLGYVPAAPASSNSK
jgi:hypothetical protein